MTDQAPNAIDTAELKAVIGNLWKKVDAFQSSAKSDTDQLNQQVAEWTQTNLVLLRLLADLSEETQNLGKNSNELAQTSIDLATTINNLPGSLEAVRTLLQRQINGANNYVTPASARPYSEANLKALQKKLATVEALLTKIEKIEVGSSEHSTQIQLKPTKSRDCSLGIIAISYALIAALNLWLGWQVRWWQVVTDPNYKLGQTLVRWNQDQLHRAFQNNQQKSTVWLVPPEKRK